VKKFAIAVAIALSIFNFAETEAAIINVDNVEIVEMSHWTKLRDHITGRRAREKERERWEQDYNSYNSDRYDRYRYDRNRYNRNRYNRSRYDDGRHHHY
jgi:hypothetical protein